MPDSPTPAVSPVKVLKSKGVSLEEFRQLLKAISRERYGVAHEHRAPGSNIYRTHYRKYTSKAISFDTLLRTAGLPRNNTGWEAFVMEAVGMAPMTVREAHNARNPDSRSPSNRPQVGHEPLDDEELRAYTNLRRKHEADAGGRGSYVIGNKRKRTIRTGGYTQVGAMYGEERRRTEEVRQCGSLLVRRVEIWIELM